MFDQDLCRGSDRRDEEYAGSEITKGCPRGETVGPWREWHDTIWTSSGRCFSNAAFSGALTEVCPATMAPTLVANAGSSTHEWTVTDHFAVRTRTIFSDNSINKFGFDGIDDEIRGPGYVVTIGKDGYARDA